MSVSEIDQNSIVILKGMIDFVRTTREILAKSFILKIKGTETEKVISKIVDYGIIRSKDFYEGAESVATFNLKRFQDTGNKEQEKLWSLIVAYICYRLLEKEKNPVVPKNKETRQTYVA